VQREHRGIGTWFREHATYWAGGRQAATESNLRAVSSNIPRFCATKRNVWAHAFVHSTTFLLMAQREVKSHRKENW